MALKFTVHGVQSFIKEHRKSGVISIKRSRDITHRISPLNYSGFLLVTITNLDRSHCLLSSCGVTNFQTVFYFQLQLVSAAESEMSFPVSEIIVYFQ